MSNPWLDAVSRGPTADAALLQVMTGLTQNLGLQAQDRLQGHEMPPLSAEGDAGENALWAAWISGWAMLQDGRPLDALDAIQRILPAGWPQPDSARLVDTEVAYVLATLLSRQNAKAPAAQIAALGPALLRRFFATYRQDPVRAGNEVLAMLAVFFGEQIIAEWTAAGVATTELASAWTVSRGVDLLTGFARIRQDGSSGIDDIIEDLLRDTAFAVEYVGTRLDDRRIAMVEMTLGDCCQASDPRSASLCYASVIRRVEPDDILALQAHAKLALMARDVTPERWDDLACSAEQSFGDLAGAAQLRILGYEARWRQGTRTSMHDEVMELVRVQEQMLPDHASFRSLFAAKQSIEIGYLLLATVNAHSDDRSTQRFDEIMSVVRALLTGSMRADLGTQESAEQDVWEALLDRQRQPSLIIREALSTNPGVGVLHLVDGIGCVIWIAYGVTREGEFFTRWGITPDDVRRCIDAPA